jgi:hypothetical protein
VPYYFWPYGGGLGAGLFYDPLWSFPHAGYGYGPGYGYAPAFGGDALDPFDTSSATGGLRLKITPNTAEVFVDGFYVGVVDDFDGHFQHLTLSAGPHRIDVRAPGYNALGLDVSIQSHHTTEYRDTLQPVAP